MTDLDNIIVRGARVNNLKNISFTIPVNSLTVVTGVSGSGKSSLAFDTVYAEGQRRYVESLSAYARQFLERMDKPDVDEVIGICPAIAINQKNSTRNPRSTVATQTEIYDYLRLLYARVGVTICRRCGSTVKRDTPESIADVVMRLPEGTRFYVLFPASAGAVVGADGDPVEAAAMNSTVSGSDRNSTVSGSDRNSTVSGSDRNSTGSGSDRVKKKRVKKPAAASINVKAHLMSLRGRGFTRLYGAAKDEIIELQTPDSYEGKDFENVYVLVDRLAVRADARSRLVDSLEICFREGHGQANVQTAGD